MNGEVEMAISPQQQLIVDRIMKKAYQTYLNESGNDWNDLFNSYSVLIAQAVISLNSNDKKIIIDILDGNGKSYDPVIDEKYTYVDNSWSFLQAQYISDPSIYLLKLLWLENLIEFEIRPPLLRMAWVLNQNDVINPNHPNFQKPNDYYKAMMHTNKVVYPKSAKIAYSDIEKWLKNNSTNANYPGINRFYSAHINIINEDMLRNAVAHRDYIMDSNRIILNVNNGKNAGIIITYPDLDRFIHISRTEGLLLKHLDSIFNESVRVL